MLMMFNEQLFLLYSELVIVGILLHGFGFVFVRIASIMLFIFIVVIIITYKKQ